MSLQNSQAELIEVLLSDASCCHFIRPDANLAIHKNNRLATLIRCLKKTYPLIAALLQEACFLETAKDYIDRYPSSSSNLHDYGEYFADFLTDYHPDSRFACLKETAQFEWLCHLTLVAKESNQQDWTAFNGLPSDAYLPLHFILHPASQLHFFHYPILHIIDICKNQQTETRVIDVQKTPLLIIRRDAQLFLIELNEAEFVFLTSLHEDGSLADAIKAVAANGVNDFKFEEKLLGWIEDRVIVGYY